MLVVSSDMLITDYLVLDVATKAINWPIQNCKNQLPSYYSIVL